MTTHHEQRLHRELVPLEPDDYAGSPREVLVHLNLEIPNANDQRSADELSDTIVAQLAVLQHHTGAPLSGIKIVCPLAEEV